MNTRQYNLFAVIALLLANIAFAQDIDPRAVKSAMNRGIAYIKNNQNNNGTFDNFDIGNTALAVIAMRSCGVKPEDKTIQQAMKYLRMFSDKEDSGRIYSVSLRTMAFALTEPKKDFQYIKEGIREIERRQNTQRSSAPHQGGWHYTLDNSSDCSCSQFAILALYEAERAGVPVPPKIWSNALRYWSASQNKDGSWGYIPQQDGSASPRGSMTCAGIASLIITAGHGTHPAAAVQGRTVLCFQKPETKYAVQIENGLDWLAKVFSVGQNPNSGGAYLYYYLYGLERVGRMTNQRFVGKHDWYREGTAKILQLQDPIDGGWHGGGIPADISNTAFALLFLSKGRRPVLMSKVQFGNDANWNMHPNDCNNLTLYTETQWKQEMTWQNIDLQSADANALLQSPVLYISGDTVDNLVTIHNVNKLRTYLDQGGFLFAEAQPNDKSFDRGFRELMSKVFPEEGYELKLLERTHPVWNAEVAIDPAQIRRIEGISYGCRTSVVYVPREQTAGSDKYKPSLSCLWEVAQIYEREDKKYPAEVQSQIEAGLGIGLNVLAYATNKELKHKDEIAEHIVKEKRGNDVQRQGRVFVPLLDYGGTNPAPHTITNLLSYMEEQLDMEVDTTSEKIQPQDEELADYPVLFMHGKEEFKFTEEQRKGLKKHLSNGGFLFANAICSSKAFAESFTSETKKMFPDAVLEKIPLNDPLLTKDDGGFDIQLLDMRTVENAPGMKPATRVRQTQPELYGLKLKDNDRWAVVFSPYDVSCALEKSTSMECRGYTQGSALKLAANVMLYALEHW